MTNTLWHFLNLRSGMALSLLYVDPPSLVLNNNHFCINYWTLFGVISQLRIDA